MLHGHPRNTLITKVALGVHAENAQAQNQKSRFKKT
jgi:hypothetical protein